MPVSANTLPADVCTFLCFTISRHPPKCMYANYACHGTKWDLLKSRIAIEEMEILIPLGKIRDSFSFLFFYGNPGYLRGSQDLDFP